MKVANGKYIDLSEINGKLSLWEYDYNAKGGVKVCQLKEVIN